MKRLRSKSRSRSGIDWILLLTYCSLLCIGLLMIYTTAYNDHTASGMWTLSSPFGSQLLWAGLSLIFVAILTLMDWHIWNSLSLLLYAVGILLLILVLVVGTEIKGAQSWLVIGPGSLQPSEFSKLATAVFCSSLLSSVQTKLAERRSQIIMMLVMVAPALLIILQPDPGSALTFFSLVIAYYRFGMPQLYYLIVISVFLVVVFSLTIGFYHIVSAISFITILLTSRFSRKNTSLILRIVALALVNVLCYQFGVMHVAAILNIVYLVVHLFFDNKAQELSTKVSILGGLSLLCLISFSSSFVFQNVLKPHQQDRINVWLQPEKCDPRGSLYNLLQSKLAIGSGGFSGKGYLNGTLTKLNYVPEQTTDFIFSSIGEEQGFLGSASVVILFLILTLRLIRIGEGSSYSFVKAYCYIIAGFIFMHFFINIGMTMGISPVIGIPLPFISKGGSALLSFSMMIGIALNMSKHR